MSVDREGIYAALYTRLQTSLSGSATTVDRRGRDFSQVDPSAQPYVGIFQGHESAEGLAGQPTKRRLHATIGVYVYSDSPSGPATGLNNLVTSVEQALEWKVGDARGRPGSSGDLGGRVEGIWITGVDTDEGTLGPQGVAIVEVEMLTHN